MSKSSQQPTSFYLDTFPIQEVIKDQHLFRSLSSYSRTTDLSASTIDFDLTDFQRRSAPTTA